MVTIKGDGRATLKIYGARHELRLVVMPADEQLDGSRKPAPGGFLFLGHAESLRGRRADLSAGASLVWPHPWPQARKEDVTLRGLPVDTEGEGFEPSRRQIDA